MALKMGRNILETECGFTMNEAANPGGVVTLSAGTASGEALDQDTLAVVTYKANPSGAKPIGGLLDVVVKVGL